MSKVFKTTIHYEFGYRDSTGREYWEMDDLLSGGGFIVANHDFGVPGISLRGYGYSAQIRDSLDARGYDEWPVLMRKIETTYYEAEEVA